MDGFTTDYLDCLLCFGFVSTLYYKPYAKKKQRQDAPIERHKKYSLLARG